MMVVSLTDILADVGALLNAHAIELVLVEGVLCASSSLSSRSCASDLILAATVVESARLSCIGRFIPDKLLVSDLIERARLGTGLADVNDDFLLVKVEVACFVEVRLDVGCRYLSRAVLLVKECLGVCLTDFILMKVVCLSPGLSPVSGTVCMEAVCVMPEFTCLSFNLVFAEVERLTPESACLALDPVLVETMGSVVEACLDTPDSSSAGSSGVGSASDTALTLLEFTINEFDEYVRLDATPVVLLDSIGTELIR